jgi:hypothetical protein
LQPLRDVFCLERAIPEIQIAIEQVGDFASGAWFPNLVQCSHNALAESTTRIWNFLHRSIHRPEEWQLILRCLSRLQDDTHQTTDQRALAAAL